MQPQFWLPCACPSFPACEPNYISCNESLAAADNSRRWVLWGLIGSGMPQRRQPGGRWRRVPGRLTHFARSPLSSIPALSLRLAPLQLSARCGMAALANAPPRCAAFAAPNAAHRERIRHRVLLARAQQQPGEPESGTPPPPQQPTRQQPKAQQAATQPLPSLADPAGVIVYGGKLPPARRLVVSGLSATAIGKRASHWGSSCRCRVATAVGAVSCPVFRFLLSGTLCSLILCSLCSLSDSLPLLQCWAATCSA